jgi:3,4-dihydroxy-2-butanone 4-phosphate synthase
MIENEGDFLAAAEKPAENDQFHLWHTAELICAPLTSRLKEWDCMLWLTPIR